MQHVDNFGNDLQLVGGYLQPDVERGQKLAAYILARIGGDIGERF